MDRLLFILGILCPVWLWGQPSAVISLQPERMETGDTTVLLLFLNGTNTEPGEVDFFPWSDQIPAQNIIKRSSWKRSGAQWMRRFTLIAFDSASLKLPPLKVRLSNGTMLETNTVQLLVFPTAGGRELTDMASIRDIRRESSSWIDYWLYGAGGLALLLTLVWWWWKNRRLPRPVEVPRELSVPPPAPKSASDEALSRLNTLLHKQYWKHDRVKDHYTEFSLILREYLERQFQIPALESTTLELNTLLAHTEASSAFQTRLEQLFTQADMVKYAQSSPNTATHQDIIEKAIQLISNPQTSAAKPADTSNSSNPSNYRI
ncbi:MAG: hypothetical protein IT261_10260 [Saprospiraceae bacterium]|nr:hypothetical protein [Saprospiraceae bacterium]